MAGGNHSASGYLTSETDPIFTEWDKDYADLTNTPTLSIADWNSAYTQINSLDASKLVATNGAGNLISFDNGTDQQVLTTNNGQLQWQTINIQTTETYWQRTGNKTHLKNIYDNIGIGTKNPVEAIHIRRKVKDNGTIKKGGAKIRLENSYKNTGGGIGIGGKSVFKAWELSNNGAEFMLNYGNGKKNNYEMSSLFSFSKEENSPVFSFKGDNSSWGVLYNNSKNAKMSSLEFFIEKKGIKTNLINFNSKGDIEAQGKIMANSFRNSNNSFILSNSGNLRINTKNKKNPLHIYKNNKELMKIDNQGNLFTRELIVKKDGDLEFPDYVFAPEYELLPLYELETYINTNQHLPEIPTAEEVEKNGIAVGTMNVQLLKKVEELTLYTIEQQKQIDEQDKQINELKKLAESLINTNQK